MEHQKNDFKQLFRIYFFQDIAVTSFLLRFFIALALLCMMLSYSPYHPSFFDQFSAVNQPSYPFGVPAALFISIFFDWFGLFSYLIPVFLLGVSFKNASFYKNVYLSIVMIFCIIAFLSIIIVDRSGVVVMMFGSLGYSSSKMVSGNFFFKTLAVITLLGGLVVLSFKVRLYKDIGLFIYRFFGLLYFIGHFYAAKLFKKIKSSFGNTQKSTESE